jgi:hypothetical protein
MEEKILRKLEEMAENPNGILPICSVENCDYIKVVMNPEDPESEFYWIGRNEFSDPKMYDMIVKSYHDLGPKSGFTEGLSHSYCPEDFKAFMAELG